jgi:mannitol/fructose-specific phosphotransferase system IIA component
MLVDNSYAKKRYIEGMMKRDNAFSTGIGNYIAIHHSEKEYKADILSTGIVVLAFHEGIDWQGSTVYLDYRHSSPGG